MSVPRNPIGLEVIGGLGKQGTNLSLTASPRDARGTISDQSLAIDQTSLENRQQAQLNRSWVTTRQPYQARGSNRLSIDFRETVHRLGQQTGLGMRHTVPLRKHRGIFQTKVSGKIDDLDSGL